MSLTRSWKETLVLSKVHDWPFEREPGRCMHAGQHMHVEQPSPIINIAFNPLDTGKRVK